MKVIIADCSAASAMFVKGAIENLDIGEVTHISFDSPGFKNVVGVGFAYNLVPHIAHALKHSEGIHIITPQRDRIHEEVRSLFSHNAPTDSLISSMTFGLPTEEDIKQVVYSQKRACDMAIDAVQAEIKGLLYGEVEIKDTPHYRGLEYKHKKRRR